MISFKKEDNHIFLIYEPGEGDPNWVTRVLENDGEVALRTKTFFFKTDDLHHHDNDGFIDVYTFSFAHKEG